MLLLLLLLRGVRAGVLQEPKQPAVEVFRPADARDPDLGGESLHDAAGGCHQPLGHPRLLSGAERKVNMERAKKQATGVPKNRILGR